MSLRSLQLPPLLETSTDDILKVLIRPCLAEATRYDRGVGFFTSQWLRMAATGLVALAGKGGHVRMITSPKLSADDWAAISQGLDATRDYALMTALRRTIEDLQRDLETEPVRALAWMVADQLLDIRLAVPSNALQDGDFHDKFGIFVDDDGDRVAFHGSMNDSAQAFRNYEGLDVFVSWESDIDRRRVDYHAGRFERLWANADVNVRVFDLPDAIRQNLVEFTSRTERPYVQPAAAANDRYRWRHQDAAMAEFLKARAGILEMATGTGKTRTAIRIIKELYARTQIDFVVVCAGGPDLLNQWRRQLVTLDLPLYCTYGGEHDETAFLNQKRGAIWIATRNALAQHLAHVPDAKRRRTLLVCDEVHGLGAPSFVRSLSGVIGSFEYRLGLSATPEREYDTDGNAFIEREIGPIVFRFGLTEAIERGILCEFDYIALPYVFTDEDRAKVRDAVAAYHAKRKAGEPVTIESLWMSVARVAKEAPNKIPAFRTYLSAHPTILRRALVFVETVQFGEMVQPELLQHTRDFHTYFSADDDVHLRRFARGELGVLLTAHRLSEGIDIQSVDTVILFSASRARLESIQRLGRCLRLDPANPNKRALVVDFVRADVESTDPDYLHADHERAEWLTALAQTRRKPDSGRPHVD